MHSAATFLTLMYHLQINADICAGNRAIEIIYIKSQINYPCQHC